MNKTKAAKYRKGSSVTVKYIVSPRINVKSWFNISFALGGAHFLTLFFFLNKGLALINIFLWINLWLFVVVFLKYVL